MRIADLEPVGYEEYLGLPETTTPLEFVDGYPIVSPSPTGPLGVAVARLLGRLQAAAAPGLEVIAGPWDWVLAPVPLLVRQPDLAVVDAYQAHEDRLTAPPVLAVEVLSEGSMERDLVHKRREYAQAGLGWYWIVSHTLPGILVLRNDHGAFTEHTAVRGTDRLTILEPFPVELSPADLVLTPRA